VSVVIPVRRRVSRALQRYPNFALSIVAWSIQMAVRGTAADKMDALLTASS